MGREDGRTNSVLDECLDADADIFLNQEEVCVCIALPGGTWPGDANGYRPVRSVLQTGRPRRPLHLRSVARDGELRLSTFIFEHHP